MYAFNLDIHQDGESCITGHGQRDQPREEGGTCACRPVFLSGLFDNRGFAERCRSGAPTTDFWRLPQLPRPHAHHSVRWI
ncbi:unnamed protein product [Tetraodon nigroviridis]|uniref:(spotted green pufferfish) hypothetical protein n=1 Tax=Tetraodon nigroviridis TaxID=99883 RepID=Q4RMH2_TETNG|nr:unnamed protein product [Tetraodon nigroviridis]